MNETNTAPSETDPLSSPVLRQIGTHLRLAREERGERLEEVATFLRIRQAYLRDLEDGELGNIPGRAYALGFLRSYADYLGFEGEAIVDEIKRTKEYLPASPSLQVREPLPESQRPPLLLAGASILLATVIYVGWSQWQERQQPQLLASLETDAGQAQTTRFEPAGSGVEPPPATATADIEPAPLPDADPSAAAGTSDPSLPPLPAVPEPPVSATADPAVGGPEEGADPASGTATAQAATDAPAATADAELGAATLPAAADPIDPASVDPADGTAGDESARDPAESLLAMVAAETGSEAPRAFGDQDARGRMVLMASEPSWVQIRSASSDFVWTRTMERGDAFFVPDREDLALWTGNAGGLSLIVDGRTTAELGERGQVRRDIPLVADELTAQYRQD